MQTEWVLTGLVTRPELNGRRVTPRNVFACFLPMSHYAPIFDRCLSCPCAGNEDGEKDMSLKDELVFLNRIYRTRQ